MTTTAKETVKKDTKNKIVDAKDLAQYDNSVMGAEIAAASTSGSESSSNETLKYKKSVEIATATYNEVVYDNLNNLYPATSPSQLAGIMSMFGVNIKKDKFRFLEIGCGVGDNIIPYANTYKNAEFVAVDLAQAAVAKGKRRSEELNLENITFHVCSFTDLDLAKLGKFDYIVAHGVYAWISKDLQEAMFEFVAKALADNGVFYVSYNTAPGWHMARATSDYLKLFCGSMPEEQKREQVPQHLAFLAKALENHNTPYALAMKSEIKTLQNQSFSYIRHDHMEESAEPVYFKDIAATASKNGIQFVSETSIGSLVVPPELALLNEVKDIVLQQCYLDFILGRRFRMSCFTKSTTVLNKNIGEHSLQDVNFISSLVTKDDTTKENIASTTMMSFGLNGAVANITSSDPRSKACLVEITKLKYKSANYSTIAAFICTEYGFDLPSVKVILTDLLIKCIIQGIIKPIYNLDWNFKASYADSDKPKLANIVRNEIDRGCAIVNGVTYNSVRLDPILSVVLSNCDGKKTITEIKEIVLAAFKENKITASTDNRMMTIEEVQQNLDMWVKNYIENSSVNGLFA